MPPPDATIPMEGCPPLRGEPTVFPRRVQWIICGYVGARWGTHRPERSHHHQQDLGNCRRGGCEPGVGGPGALDAADQLGHSGLLGFNCSFAILGLEYAKGQRWAGLSRRFRKKTSSAGRGHGEPLRTLPGGAGPTAVGACWRQVLGHRFRRRYAHASATNRKPSAPRVPAASSSKPCERTRTAGNSRRSG